MNVLGIGAHFDDLEIGCSGTLIKHVQSQDKVTMLVLTDSAYNNPENVEVRDVATARSEGEAAADIIGADLICLDYKTWHLPFDESLTSRIRYYIEKLEIDIIYSHWVYDLHRDHQYAGKSTLMAGRHVPRYLMYRSNYYDTEQQFRGNFYSDISEVFEKKIEVIKSHKSELERVDYSWLEFINKQNGNDGQKTGVAYSECFEVVRYLV